MLNSKSRRAALRKHLRSESGVTILEMVVAMLILTVGLLGLAAAIGYAPSMFQWEIGWADIALGVIGVLCARRSNRGKWTSATLVALTVSFFGDGIGHITQLLGHGNTAPDNVWAIPTCFLVPALSALFVYLARRHGAFTRPSTAATTENVTAAAE